MMGADADTIETHIREVRERMAHRIDAVSRELDAKAMAARFTGKENPGPGDIVDTIALMARRSPLSTALVGMGLAGMLASEALDGSRGARANGAAGSADGRGYKAGASETDDAMTRAAAEAVRGSAERLRESALDMAGSAADGIRRFTAETADAAARRARQARRSAEAAGDNLNHGAGFLADWVRSNPIATGLMVMAAGAAVASIVMAGRNGGRAPQDRFGEDRRWPRDDEDAATASGFAAAPPASDDTLVAAEEPLVAATADVANRRATDEEDAASGAGRSAAPLTN